MCQRLKRKISFGEPSGFNKNPRLIETQSSRFSNEYKGKTPPFQFGYPIDCDAFSTSLEKVEYVWISLHSN